MLAAGARAYWPTLNVAQRRPATIAMSSAVEGTDTAFCEHFSTKSLRTSMRSRSGWGFSSRCTTSYKSRGAGALAECPRFLGKEFLERVRQDDGACGVLVRIRVENRALHWFVHDGFVARDVETDLGRPRIRQRAAVRDAPVRTAEQK